jgi:DNA modification methylase
VKPYYDQEGITIYHSDCRDVLPLVAFDVMVTDPPYGIGWRRGVNAARASKSHDGIAGDADTSVRDAALTLSGGRPAVVFGSFYAPFPPGVRQVLVWHKPADAGVVGSTTGYRRDAEPIFLVGDWPLRPVAWSSVIRSAAGSIAATTVATGHPHTKPVDLMMKLLALSNGVVVDPFMGSGSTLVAAKRMGRVAIGIEVDEAYCEVAAKRLAQGVLFGAEQTACATTRSRWRRSLRRVKRADVAIT